MERSKHVIGKICGSLPFQGSRGGQLVTPGKGVLPFICFFPRSQINNWSGVRREWVEFRNRNENKLGKKEDRSAPERIIISVKYVETDFSIFQQLVLTYFKMYFQERDVRKTSNLIFKHISRYDSVHCTNHYSQKVQNATLAQCEHLRKRSIGCR
ncbi:hypothetical protein CEXT_260221 [Caerostris extrusa]|uniref:Uncharacterized protein n=1 Tax=Caerostris extrusa TaxID=172846 RepID=A0AAV4PRR3_CAEEX|nr:hypothetical protein CEXT_260221 [Caerostris extrusa]